MKKQENDNSLSQNVQYVPVRIVSDNIIENDIDLFEMWNILWNGKFLVAMIFLICMVISIFTVFFVLTPKFRAIAVVRATEYSQPVIEDYLGSVNFKRRLVERLDLLPYFSEKSWSFANKIWKNNLQKDIRTIHKIVESDNFPLKFIVNKQNKLISVVWDGDNPDLAVENLEKSLDILSEYMSNEYVTDYQVAIKIIQEEFEPLAPALRFAEDASFQWDENSIEQAELLSAYAILKNKLADQRSKDALSRKFSIISHPGPPSEPFSPKRFLVLGGTAFGSLFIGILVVFLRSAVRRVRARNQKADA